MNVYRLDEIATDVRIALDQNMASDALTEIGDVDTLALNDIIKSKIVEAVKRVHSSAPAHLLDGGHSFVDKAVYWKELESGWVLLPEDFMRFVAFKMSDWQHAVFTCMSTDDAEYQLQTSPFKGVRGTAQNPKCFIVVRPEGRVLEFYSSKSTDAEVVQAVYLPYPKIDEFEAVEICSKCYNAVVYTIASLVIATFGDTDKTNIFNELAKSSLI